MENSIYWEHVIEYMVLDGWIPASSLWKDGGIDHINWYYPWEMKTNESTVS